MAGKQFLLVQLSLDSEALNSIQEKMLVAEKITPFFQK
jgi:hypothetical protein